MTGVQKETVSERPGHIVRIKVQKKQRVEETITDIQRKLGGKLTKASLLKKKT